MFKAGLFSAILTAFIIEVYKGLNEDFAAVSVQIFQRISMQLGDPTVQHVVLPGPYTPPSRIVAVNVLWFSALILSLFTALFGILAKQWLHAHSKWSEDALPKETLALRYFYQEGLIRWRVPEIIGILPTLLQVALLLFVVGLVIYLWTLHVVLAGVLSAMVVAMIILAGLTIALPVFNPDCPYKTPLGLIFAALRPGPLHFSSWRSRDRSTAGGSSSDLVAMLSSVLDIHPPSLLNSELQRDDFNETLIGARIIVLSEALPSILQRIFTDFARYWTLSDERRLLRDLWILERISLIKTESDLFNIADATMTVFKKMSSPSPSPTRRNWAECLQVILRIIHRRLEECKPCA
jgi:hypothetical protein